jgi:hypothetical protein
MTAITYLALAVIYLPLLFIIGYVVGALLKARWRD